MTLFQQLIGKRVVLITGKGGVGRTTVAAAVAKAAAAAGRRTLVAEISEPVMPASSPLAIKFGLKMFARDPARLGERLSGARLCTVRGTEHFLTAVFRVPALARLALRSKPLLRFLHAVPSFHELGIFYHLLHWTRERDRAGALRHELIVIDMPATGHTLALTGLPEVMLRLISAGPIATAMREGQALLNHPATAGAYVVTLPEKLPVSESLQLIAGLRETAMPVGGVVVNRVPRDPFTPAEREALAEMLSGRDPVLGQDELARVGRAQEAVRRLDGLGVPVLEIDELPGEGASLVDAVAAGMVGGR